MKRKHTTVTSVYVARYESSRFTFEAADITESGAIEALCAGMRRHARQVGIADDEWWSPDDIIVRYMAFGSAYRDGAVLLAKGGAA